MEISKLEYYKMDLCFSGRKIINKLFPSKTFIVNKNTLSKILSKLKESDEFYDKLFAWNYFLWQILVIKDKISADEYDEYRTYKKNTDKFFELIKKYNIK